MQTVAVLGGRGRLGRAALQAFQAQGHTVIAVTRDGRLPQAPPGVIGRAADALNRRQLQKAVRDADCIINALNPPYTPLAADRPAHGAQRHGGGVDDGSAAPVSGQRL
ncbi:MAG: NAD-dependent epimerase/dehydratase family protein [Thiolinea sp.]